MPSRGGRSKGKSQRLTVKTAGNRSEQIPSKRGDLPFSLRPTFARIRKICQGESTEAVQTRDAEAPLAGSPNHYPRRFCCRKIVTPKKCQRALSVRRRTTVHFRFDPHLGLLCMIDANCVLRPETSPVRSDLPGVMK